MAEAQQEDEKLDAQLESKCDDFLNLKEICERARLGDEEALDYLKLEEDMTFRTWRVSSENREEVKEEMEQGIDDCVYHIEAASRLGMRHCKCVQANPIPPLQAIPNNL